SDHDCDNASIHNEAPNNHQQPNIKPHIITTVTNNNAKFPYLKKDEYEVWAMKMKHWITNNDMNIWKVIKNGNSLKRTRRVKARFGGNAESKKMRKSMLEQEFLEFRISEAEGVHKGHDRMQKILSQLNQLGAKLDAEEINLRISEAEGVHKGHDRMQKILSQLNQLGAKPDAEEINLRVHKFEKKARRKIDFDKKESSRFIKQKVRCNKCQQRGHFARECRAKGGNDKQRYSSFKNKEIGKMEEDSKALVIIDTLVDWSNHDSESDEVIAAKEFGMIVGANSEEANTPNDAGEFALMGVTSESVTNDFVSCDDSDKSSEVKTSDFASSNSSGKFSKNKPTDSTSCASTSSVSTSVNEAEIESNVGTPMKEPISVQDLPKIESNVGTPMKKPISVQDLPSFTCNSSDKTEQASRTSCNERGSFNKKAGHFKRNASFVSKLCFVCGSRTHLIKDCDFYKKQMANSTVGIGVGPAIRPQPVPTGKLKVKPVPTGKPKVKPVPTGKPKVKPVPTGKTKVNPVSTGKPKV
nr:hypothetical protein [Tanacetum cinerariifolium]